MTPPLEYRAYIDNDQPDLYGSRGWKKGEIWEFNLLDLLGSDDSDYQLLEDSLKRGRVAQFTGHNSIDDKKVFAGDYLRFTDTEQVYEVRWDNDEGSWGIFYKGMNCFKIGMARFMVVARNKFDGEKITESKEAK